VVPYFQLEEAQRGEIEIPVFNLSIYDYCLNSFNLGWRSLLFRTEGKD
jgi:hypothetical protein